MKIILSHTNARKEPKTSNWLYTINESKCLVPQGQALADLATHPILQALTKRHTGSFENRLNNAILAPMNSAWGVVPHQAITMMELNPHHPTNGGDGLITVCEQSETVSFQGKAFPNRTLAFNKVTADHRRHPATNAPLHANNKKHLRGFKTHPSIFQVCAFVIGWHQAGKISPKNAVTACDLPEHIELAHVICHHDKKLTPTGQDTGQHLRRHSEDIYTHLERSGTFVGKTYWSPEKVYPGPHYDAMLDIIAKTPSGPHFLRKGQTFSKVLSNLSEDDILHLVNGLWPEDDFFKPPAPQTFTSHDVFKRQHLLNRVQNML